MPACSKTRERAAVCRNPDELKNKNKSIKGRAKRKATPKQILYFSVCSRTGKIIVKKKSKKGRGGRPGEEGGNFG